jgi:hypothetical protein
MKYYNLNKSCNIRMKLKYTYGPDEREMRGGDSYRPTRGPDPIQATKEGDPFWLTKEDAM